MFQQGLMSRQFCQAFWERSYLKRMRIRPKLSCSRL